MRGKDRNKPCICGSGLKTKKCCKGIGNQPNNVITEPKIDVKKIYDISHEMIDQKRDYWVKRMIESEVKGDPRTPKFIDKTVNPFTGKEILMGEMVYLESYTLIQRIMMFSMNKFDVGILNFNQREFGVSSVRKDMVKDVFTFDSSFDDLSEEKKEYFISSMVDLMKLSDSHYEKLMKLYKNIGSLFGSTIGDFRTQKVDIEKTNVFSCFDDVNYSIIEWVYENIDFLNEFVHPISLGEIIRKLYLRLGKPKNRVEIKTNTIEKLLSIVKNDENILEGFRINVMSSIDLEPNSQKSIYNTHRKYFDRVEELHPTLLQTLKDHNHFQKITGLHLNLVLNENHYYGGEKEQEDSVITYDIDWISRIEDNDMVSLYRSVNDKNHPLGWSWTLNKNMSVNWIRNRGLVGDDGKVVSRDKSYLVEVRVPKSELMMIYNTTEGGNNYLEVVMTEESLKDRDLKITELNFGDLDQLTSTFLSDKKLSNSLIHDSISQLVPSVTGSLSGSIGMVNKQPQVMKEIVGVMMDLTWGGMDLKNGPVQFDIKM